jgi:thiamine biosynthesis lipoprotein
MRNIFYVAFLFLFSCSNNNETQEENSSSSWMHLEGEAQGTTFSIKYEDKEGRDFSKDVKVIFDEMDQQLSTYVDSSLISRLNNAGTTFNENCTCYYFKSVFEMSKSIHDISDGAFNPLVFPLVEYWGFGKKAETPDEIDDDKINDLLEFLKYDSVKYNFDEATVSINRNPQIKFDFFGIAQGYTVDVIAEFLESKGVKNYMVEVGGEVRAKGKNERKLIWNLGIEKPTDVNAQHELQATIKLNNRSMATSGNYRKFYEKNGVRYSHTIDSKTGYPVQHSLLSATILAPDCASADAYATVFMVMGLEKGKEFLANHPELILDAYLIYSENGKFKTWSSKGIRELIEEVN